jgi:hypothetical protein
MRGTASTGSSAANSPGRPSAAGAVSECPRSNRNLYRSLSLFLYRRQVRGIRGTRAAGQQGLAAATPTPERDPLPRALRPLRAPGSLPASATTTGRIASLCVRTNCSGSGLTGFRPIGSLAGIEAPGPAETVFIR